METAIEFEEVKRRMIMVINYYRDTKSAMAKGDLTLARKINWQFQQGNVMTSDILGLFLGTYHGRVSPDWLFFGEGDMIPERKPKTITETPKMAICRLLNELSDKVDKLPI